MATQPKNGNLDYMIDPTCKNIRRLFLQSFKVGSNDLARNFLDMYHMQ